MLNFPGESGKCSTSLQSLEGGQQNKVLHGKINSFVKKTARKHYRPIEIFFIRNRKSCLSTTGDVIEVIQHCHVPTTQKIGT